MEQDTRPVTQVLSNVLGQGLFWKVPGGSELIGWFFAKRARGDRRRQGFNATVDDIREDSIRRKVKEPRLLNRRKYIPRTDAEFLLQRLDDAREAAS